MIILDERYLRKLINKKIIKEYARKKSHYKFDPNSATLPGGQESEISTHGIGSSIISKLSNINISKKSGVDIDSLNRKTKKVIKTVFKVAKELKVETPVITSGYRGPASQIRVMHNNWKRNGGKNNPAKARKYFVDLYKNDKLVIRIHDLFLKDDFRGAEAELTNIPISSHQSKSAFDLRLTKGIEKVLSDNRVKSLIRPFKEGSVKESDHYHIAV